MSARGTSLSRGSRANVGSPPYLGTTVASTWPTIPSTVTRGSVQGSGPTVGLAVGLALRLAFRHSLNSR